MKGKISTVLVGLLMAALLIGTNVRIQAQGNVAETEPNDNKAQAQTAVLGTTYTGSVAQSDQATFVEMLETDFSPFNDPIEDWLKFTVMGPTEAAFSLDWTLAAADLDFWILADATDILYTDSLVAQDAAASLDKPEILSNRLYYRYSDREEEANDDDPALPESSDYYVAISHYNPSPAGRTDWTLTTSAPMPGSTRVVRHNASGLGPWNIVNGSRFQMRRNIMRVLTQITPAEYPARLDNVQFLQFTLPANFPADLKPRVGEPFKIVAFLDADGDGNLANAMQVLDRNVTLTELSSDPNSPVVLLTYDLRDANIRATQGDIYVGIEADLRTTKLHFPFDGDRPGYFRSPIFLDGGDQSFLLLNSDLTGGPLIANAGLDADLTINPPAGKVAYTGQKVTVRPAPWAKLADGFGSVSTKPSAVK